jgi:hypothetical protein
MKIELFKPNEMDYSKKINPKIDKKYSKELTGVNQSRQSGDSLEISDGYKKLQFLRTRIKDGFYDNPDVIKEVASRIDTDLKNI